MTAHVPEHDQKTILTLSAAPASDRQNARSSDESPEWDLTPEDRVAADRFRDLLELQDRALARGLPSLAAWYADRIADEMTAGAAR
jgi:hypothetical protein